MVLVRIQEIHVVFVSLAGSPSILRWTLFSGSRIQQFRDSIRSIIPCHQGTCTLSYYNTAQANRTHVWQYVSWPTRRKIMTIDIIPGCNFFMNACQRASIPWASRGIRSPENNQTSPQNSEIALHRLFLRAIGFRHHRRRTDPHPGPTVPYPKALTNTQSYTLRETISERRLVFAGAVTRIKGGAMAQTG